MMRCIDPVSVPPHDVPDDGHHVDRARATDDLDRRDLAAVAGGDAAALERLYERHAPSLHAFIRRYVADRQLAEEALQDTMVAVWERAATFRSESTVRTWMFGVARFRALGAVRRRRPEHLDGDVEFDGHRPVEDGAGADDPARVAVARDELDRVGGALAQLPDDQRECFVLAVAGSVSYDDIAGLLGVSVGTVKSRVSRARRRLDDLLAPLGEEDGT